MKVPSLLLCFLTLTLPPLSADPATSLHQAPYPTAASKKGLQVEIVEDALALGIKHAALNLNLSQLVDPAGHPDNPTCDHGGKTFHFQRAYLASLDSQIRALSEKGVLVNLILLAYQSHDPKVNAITLHPAATASPPNRLCAFNTVTEEGRAWFAASTAFLAERYSRPSQEFGRAVGYIIGNEVNSHWWWANMGRTSMADFTADYLRTVRLAHTSIRSQSSFARVYISLEHHWNIRYPAGDDLQSFPGRAFLDHFAKSARDGGDFDWHLAFHPYPENLRDPRFWNDKSATPDPDTPRITFKNLGVLTGYLKRPELLHAGSPRRIILSEQGFDTPDSPDGEAIQAAAFCLAYKIVEPMEGIDAFILHRHVDHRHEGGLRLGLRRWDDARTKKQIYEPFRLADTPEWEAAFSFALPLVGRTTW